MNDEANETANARASWIGPVGTNEVPSLQDHLQPFLHTLESRVDSACPGRTAAVIDAAVRGALGLSHTMPGNLDAAEQVVHMLAEQFVIDVHGVTDQQFDLLKGHYGEPDIVAMLFRMALADGLGKLERVA